jgi:hypothetical protein
MTMAAVRQYIDGFNKGDAQVMEATAVCKVAFYRACPVEVSVTAMTSFLERLGPVA